MNVDASVIVPTHGGVHRLPPLLAALERQALRCSWEVVVAVDGVVDDTPALLASWQERLPLRVHVLDEHAGRAAALNAGYGAAAGRVLIRCDDDLTPRPDFVARHHAWHRDTDGLGVIGLTRDVLPHNPYARAYGATATERAREAARRAPDATRWQHWAANNSLVRATWERVCGFAPLPFGEDVELGWRLHEAGISIVIDDALETEHRGPATDARTRAQRAFVSGAAHHRVDALHASAAASRAPAAPPDHTSKVRVWNALVAGTARLEATAEAAARVGAAVDTVLPWVPPTVGRALVAASVEGAALAGYAAGDDALDGAPAQRAAQRARELRTNTAEPATEVTGRGGRRGNRPRVAIVHDYLTQRGGAERVVLSMLKAFPDAELHTSVFDPANTYDAFSERPVHTHLLNRVEAIRRDHRIGLPFYAPAFSGIAIDADVVIASSSGWAHAVRTSGRKIVYCYNPARWLYQPAEYLGDAGRAQRWLLAAASPGLRRWDRWAAGTADEYCAISSTVADRIRATYGISPRLLPPPPTMTPDGLAMKPARLAHGDEPYVLCVSRLLGYKNVDALLAAFATTPHRRLVVVGTGPDESRLAELAPANVQLLGTVTDPELRWLYAHCRALVSASFEDYGLTPLEAATFGRPSVVIRKGGFLDTVVDGTTGLFFDAPSPVQIRRALDAAEDIAWDEDAIARHAETFAEVHFIEKLQALVGAHADAGAGVP